MNSIPCWLRLVLFHITIVQYESCINSTLITVLFFKKKGLVSNSHVKMFKVRESFYDNRFERHMVLQERALPFWGALDEVVNIGVSSLAVLHIILLRRARLQSRGLRWQKLAAEPKPESYPQMNSRRCTVQQALPHFRRGKKQNLTAAKKIRKKCFFKRLWEHAFVYCIVGFLISMQLQWRFYLGANAIGSNKVARCDVTRFDVVTIKNTNAYPGFFFVVFV